MAMSYISKRYLVAILSTFGFFFLSILTEKDDLPPNWRTPTRGIHYTWNERYFTKLSSTFGLLTSLVAGVVSNCYGGAIVFGTAILLKACISLITLLLYSSNLIWILSIAFIDGVLLALACSSIADVWSRWSTRRNRSKYVAVTLIGQQLASTIPPLFWYMNSNIIRIAVTVGAIIWSIIWLLMVQNDPSQDQNLSDEEKTILAQRLKVLDEKGVTLNNYPWSQIFTSKPLWALCLAAFVSGGINNYYSMAYYYNFPTSDFQEHLDQIQAILMPLNNIFNAMIAGYVIDFIRNKEGNTNTKVHRIFICLNFIIQGLLILFFGIINLTYGYKLIFLTVIIASTTFVEVSIQVNVLDLSPRYASLLQGIQKLFYYIDIASLSLVSDTMAILWLIIGLFISALIYFDYGSGELQPWNGLVRDEHELELNKDSTTI